MFYTYPKVCKNKTQRNICLKKTKQEAQQTREAILQSAMDLFYQKGYSKTSFDEIALTIGLTKGAIYWHFKNKPELVAAIIDEYVTRKMAYLKQKVPVLRDFKDIEAYFLAMADYLLGDKNATKVAFFLSLQMEWSESVITKVLESLSQNTKDCFEYVKNALFAMQEAEQIRSDIAPVVIAEIIFSLWTGTLEAYFSKRLKTDLKTAVQNSFDLLSNGLFKRKD